MIQNKSFAKGQGWEDGIDCKGTHQFWGMKEMFYVMIMVVDIYVCFQNSLNSTLIGEFYYVNSIPQKNFKAYI